MDLLEDLIWHCSNSQKNILNNKQIELFNGGLHVRDFTYVDDIINGIISIINRPSKKGDTL